MKITESFIQEILKKEYPAKWQEIYDLSPLLQYLDRKMKAVHGNCKTRRSLANIYAIYSILYFYRDEFCGKPKTYRSWMDELKDRDLDEIIRNVDLSYRMEMNLDPEEDE